MNRGFVLPLLAAENESSHAAITAWGVSHFSAALRRSGSHLGSGPMLPGGGLLYFLDPTTEQM